MTQGSLHPLTKGRCDPPSILTVDSLRLDEEPGPRKNHDTSTDTEYWRRVDKESRICHTPGGTPSRVVGQGRLSEEWRGGTVTVGGLLVDTRGLRIVLQVDCGESGHGEEELKDCP